MQSFRSAPMLSIEFLALIATYIEEREISLYLTYLADGFLIRETRDKDIYANGLLHSFNDQPAAILGDESSNIKVWCKFGLQHRDGDEPAVIHSSGRRLWYRQGLLHRDNDGPAKIYADGTQEWYRQGLLHRDNDEPAKICPDGTQEWYQNDFLHRDGDRPALVQQSGTRAWYFRGQLHRENDKPAIIGSDGTCQWYKNGISFRECGPKMTFVARSRLKEFYRKRK